MQEKRGRNVVWQYRYITFQDRKQISTRYLNGDRVADIADGLGVTAATVYRELKRGETGGLDRNQRRAYRNPLPPLHLSTTAQAGKAQHARFTVP